MKKALLVIDLQNDYFPGGAFPLWNTDQTLENVLKQSKRQNAATYPLSISSMLQTPKSA